MVTLGFPNLLPEIPVKGFQLLAVRSERKQIALKEEFSRLNQKTVTCR
jgi:hypothetical protein